MSVISYTINAPIFEFDQYIFTMIKHTLRTPVVDGIQAMMLLLPRCVPNRQLIQLSIGLTTRIHKSNIAL